jgi:hypothetical protein
MAHRKDGGAAASPLRPGLQGCDITDLEFDSATDPKEGGNGDLLPSHAPQINVLESFIAFCSGVVLRAFYHGTEAAVKRPRIKVTLNPRDLKKFTLEVTTMCKVSTSHRPAAVSPADIFRRSTTRTACKYSAPA